MLNDSTKSAEGGVCAGPLSETGLNGGNNIIERRKVLIMQAAAANQFPDSFNGIKVRAVRRQEVQSEVVGDPCAPRRVEGGMMIAGIVNDDDHAAPWPAADALKLPEEIPAGLRIEHSLGRRHGQLTVLQSDSAEETDAFASRGVQANWIGDLRWNPQAAARAMLLKVHFIHGPQIDAGFSSQATEFFYAQLELRGPLGRLGGAACAAENQVAETGVGTAALSSLRPISGEETQTRLDRPTFVWADQTVLDWRVRPLRPRPIALHSNDRAAPGVRLRTARRAPLPQNAAPSLPPLAASRPITQPLADRSCLEPPAALHGADGRTGTHRCDEFHPVTP